MDRRGSVVHVRTAIALGYRLLLVLLLFSQVPAQAGYYGHYLQSGSGTMTITPNGGSSQVIPLSSPDFYEGYPTGHYGTMSFTYSETYNYHWIPDDGYSIDDDPPTSQTLNMSGSASFDLIGTSGCAWVSGSASGSITINGSTASAQHLTEPDGNGGAIELTNTSGYYTIPVAISLSGEDGSYTITYSGQLTAQNVIGAAWSLSRPGASPGKYIRIRTPKSTDDPLTTGVNFPVEGWWETPVWERYTGQYEIRVYAQHPGGQRHHKATVQGTPGQSWGVVIQITDEGPVTIIAELWWKFGNLGPEIATSDPNLSTDTVSTEAEDP